MKKQKTMTFGLMSILLLSVIFVSGCTSENSSIATSSQNNVVPDITEEQKQMEILATATHASVDNSGGKNWDADLEDDGIIIYPSLKDAKDETVNFEGIELTVDIE